jgi:hypothetical protein
VGKDWILVVVSAVMVYALHSMLKLIFGLIDLYHQRERLSAAEPRRGVAEQAEGTGGC